MSEKRFNVSGHSSSQCQGVINYSVGGLSGNYPNITYSVTVKAGWYSHVAGHGVNYSNSSFKWTQETKKDDVNWRASGAGYSPWYASKTYTFSLGNGRSGNMSTSLSVSTYSPYNFSGTITASSASVEAPTGYGLSVSGITEKSVVVSHTMSNKRNYWRVQLKDTISGKTWSLNSNTGSGSTTISGLTANTSYNFVIQVIDRGGSVRYTSSAKSVKTLGISKVGNTPTITLGSSFPFVITGYSDSFTHNVTFTAGGYSFSRSGLYRGTNTISLSATEIDTLYSKMSTVRSMSMSISLSTYTGGSLIGSNTGSGTVQINTADATPIVNSFTYSDLTAIATTITGSNKHVIQNVSKISVSSISVSVKKYATIAQYRLVIGNRTITSSSATINDTGVVDSNSGFTIQVVDSRGLVGSKNIPFDKYYAYALPSLKLLSSRRKNSIEDSVYLKLDGTFVPITVGSTKKNNTVTATWCSKKTSDSTYGAYKAISTFNDGVIKYDNIVGDLDAEYSYNIRVQLKDSLGTSLFDNVIAKGTPDMSITKDGVAIGKIADTPNYLDSAWPIKTPSIEIINGIGGKGFRCGFVNITPKANTPTSVHVNAEFAKTPRVCVSAVSSVPGTMVLGVSAGNIDQSGFDIFVTRTNTTVTMIAWIASCEV